MWNRLSPVGRAALAVVLVLGLGVAAERGRWFPRLLAAGSPERIWIWSAASPREVRPRAFFLARDFELGAVPANARLEVLADPEYLLRLNGRRVGSGVYRPGAPIDVYDATSLLRAGRNRLLLELRSPIGSGGATLRLADGDGRTLVASDREWRLYQGSWRALADLGAPLPKAPTAAVLGRAPYARWELPAERMRAPYLAEVRSDGLVPARAWRDAAGEAPWERLPERRGQAIRGGELVEVDFGREVAGYLQLDFRARAANHGLLYFAAGAGEPLDRAPDRVVVPVPTLGFWQDVEPRRFRYVTVVGLPALRAVSVVPLRAGAARQVVAPEPSRGLLGLAVDPATSPLVEEIRRRALGGAGGAR